MTSITTPDVIQDAVSHTISGDSNVNQPDDGRQLPSNPRNSSKHTNANRYLRTEVAFWRGISA